MWIINLLLITFATMKLSSRFFLLSCLNFLPFCLSLRRGTSHYYLNTLPQQQQQQQKRQQCLLCIRGGQNSQDPYHYQQGQQSPPRPSPVQQQEERSGYQSNNYDTTEFYTPPTDDPMHETVQDRVDKWRMDQISKRENQTPQEEANLRDEQGRMKLLVSVSKASRVFIFFLLMWRDIHLYEVADTALKGLLRTLTVVPLTVLFTANLAGVIISFTTALSHGGKKRLKAILNLDKMVEIVLVGWNFLRLTVMPSKYIPREIHVAGIIHSIFFIIQCQAFTRVNWDEKYLTAAGSTTHHNHHYDQDPYSSSSSNDNYGLGQQYYSYEGGSGIN